ncbi:HlyD family efflux transporter periplasmic adaptor subunit [Gilliamella sp. B2824]|uniref:HlyD family secretion protein n=1 Tax=Gilliamella sp. B2824 TaxID=2818019 RepID=UPI00226A4391|nr:HlyD family efflux transporter periplasmic adaptor subunit [Gilliamella sp. B2824]MCX8739156.1 HlyD family efflux transporter periplasmic adaptor subunit [Gilliamella sp. B2824]
MDKEIDSPPQPIKRKKKLIILTLLFLFFALAYGVYWFMFSRFNQSTDNAYVMGNQVPVDAQVNGGIVEINVDNNDFIQQNDVIATIDAVDAENEFGYAKNALIKAIRELHQIQITNEKLSASIQLKQVTLDKLKQDLERRENLWSRKVISKEEIIHARQDVDFAINDLKISQHELAINNALLMKTPLLEQPSIQQAIFKLKQAWLNLKRTKITAPVTGYVARRSVQVGTQVTKGERLMVIVPLDQVWVEANFKEVQLNDIRIGQPVTLESDYYGEKVEYKGKISGIAMGTGGAFSLLPAQNATGNWIKVIQRLPVRIELDKAQLKQFPLRIGLSMNVNVDTHDTSGKLLTDIPAKTIKYQTDSLSFDESEFEQLVEDIVKTNFYATQIIQ